MDRRRRGYGASPLGAVPALGRGAVGLIVPLTPSAGRWTVDRWHGQADAAHGDPWPSAAVAAVRLVEADGPALVLGSTQRPEIVDHAAAEAAGVAVVQRRSGGGAVLVGTGDVVWVDVFVPADDRLWEHDVGRATHWLGRVWTATLATLGLQAGWHEGPLLTTAWSALVCFAGLGPGEVRAGNAKVVGISQRRTRDGALFQCAALLGWDPAPTLAVLMLDASERRRAERELAGVATGMRLGITAAAVHEAFLAELARR